MPGVGLAKNGATRAFASDMLGTQNNEVDPTNAVTSDREYDAFGNVLSQTGAPLSSGGYAGDLGYGQDDESGFKCVGHRVYDSNAGRFLTTDPACDGRNWYAYCSNDPMGTVDPSGLAAGGGGGGPWATGDVRINPFFDMSKLHLPPCLGTDVDWDFGEDVIGNGLDTGVHGVFAAFSCGMYDGGDFKNQDGFQGSKFLGTVALVSLTAAVGGEAAAGGEEGAAFEEGAAAAGEEGAEGGQVAESSFAGSQDLTNPDILETGHPGLPDEGLQMGSASACPVVGPARYGYTVTTAPPM